MIRFGMDSNILLRVMLNDDPRQSALARDLLAGIGEQRRGYVGISAVLEIFWVLRSRYKVPRQTICELMRHLLSIKFVDVESSEALAQALSIYQKKRADFPDALLAQRNAEADCHATYTFDKDAAKSIPSMELLA